MSLLHVVDAERYIDFIFGDRLQDNNEMRTSSAERSMTRKGRSTAGLQACTYRIISSTLQRCGRLVTLVPLQARVIGQLLTCVWKVRDKEPPLGCSEICCLSNSHSGRSQGLQTDSFSLLYLASTHYLKAIQFRHRAFHMNVVLRLLLLCPFVIVTTSTVKGIRKQS
jgi:hypothetical protein